MGVAQLSRSRRLFTVGRLLGSLAGARPVAVLACPQVEALEDRFAPSTSPMPRLIKDINHVGLGANPEHLTNFNGIELRRS